MLSCWNCNTRITGIVVAPPPPQPPAPRAPLPLYEAATTAAAATRATGAAASSAGEQHWSNEHWPLEAAAAATLGAHNNNGRVDNGRRGAGRLASPEAQPLYRRHGSGGGGGGSSSKEPRQQRRQRDQKGSPPPPPRGLRRCRAWIICRQDTILALDIEVDDYGEPPLPPPPPVAVTSTTHGGGMNGASSGGGRGFQNGSSTGRHVKADIKVEECREDDGAGGGRRHGNGLGLAGGGGGGESPRFTPRRKTGGSCSIDESVRKCETLCSGVFVLVIVVVVRRSRAATVPKRAKGAWVMRVSLSVRECQSLAGLEATCRFFGREASATLK